MTEDAEQHSARNRFRMTLSHGSVELCLHNCTRTRSHFIAPFAGPSSETEHSLVENRLYSLHHVLRRRTAFGEFRFEL